MQSDDRPNGAEHGVTHVKVPTLIITLELETHMVHLTCDGVAISVAQMMLDEVQRQLEIQRRQAAALELQQKIADARFAAAIAGGHGMKG